MGFNGENKRGIKLKTKIEKQKGKYKKHKKIKCKKQRNIKRQQGNSKNFQKHQHSILNFFFQGSLSLSLSLSLRALWNPRPQSMKL